jgi:hypothetical protein
MRESSFGKMFVNLMNTFDHSRPGMPASLLAKRELFKEFKEFFNLRCRCFIKNKKIKNLLHTRAPFF